MCYCYLHIFPNSKIYVGTTQQEKPELRWKNGYGYRKNKHLYSAIYKYGWENVKHKVIVCETLEEMWEKEKELIKKYDTTNPAKGYNHSLGGEKSSFGIVRTDEFKKKVSESHKDMSFTEEHRRHISESAKNKPPVSDETRRKISEACKGKGTGPKPKLKWLTPQGEIREMYISNVKQWHPDWILIQNKE